MVHFNLRLLPPDNVIETIIETRFIVSTSSDMVDDAVEIIQLYTDVPNVLSYVGSLDLPEVDVYYVTGVYITVEAGLSFTSVVTELVSNGITYLGIDNFIPNVVPSPLLETLYPEASHPSKDYIITTNELDVQWDRQFATTWILSNVLTNIVIESSLMDEDNLYNKKFVSDLIPGLYEIKVRRHMKSGASSVFSSITFIVNEDSKIYEDEGLYIDRTLTTYIEKDVESFTLVSETDELMMRIFDINGVISETEIDSGVTNIEPLPFVTIQIFVIGKEDNSSIYIYPLEEYDNCGFTYTFPITFCEENSEEDDFWLGDDFDLGMVE